MSTSKPPVLKYCKDLGSLIGNTQCGNFRIILPFRFLREINFELPKTAILTISEPLNFEFLRNVLHFSSVKFFQKSKFKAFKIVKITVFDHLKSAKIDFTQNQSGRKNAKFLHCVIP